jgi:hypothetical protein
MMNSCRWLSKHIEERKVEIRNKELPATESTRLIKQEDDSISVQELKKVRRFPQE